MLQRKSREDTMNLHRRIKTGAIYNVEYWADLQNVIDPAHCLSSEQEEKNVGTESTKVRHSQ